MKIKLVGTMKFWIFKKNFKIAITVDENDPEYPVAINDSGELYCLFAFRETDEGWRIE